MRNTIFKSVSEEWDGFSKSVLPKNASATQISEMRMAFFAGAWTIITQMERIGESDISEDDGVCQMEALKQECIEFQREYMRRYAEKN